MAQSKITIFAAEDSEMEKPIVADEVVNWEGNKVEDAPPEWKETPFTFDFEVVDLRDVQVRYLIDRFNRCVQMKAIEYAAKNKGKKKDRQKWFDNVIKPFLNTVYGIPNYEVSLLVKNACLTENGVEFDTTIVHVGQSILLIGTALESEEWMSNTSMNLKVLCIFARGRN